MTFLDKHAVWVPVTALAFAFSLAAIIGRVHRPPRRAQRVEAGPPRELPHAAPGLRRWLPVGLKGHPNETARHAHRR